MENENKEIVKLLPTKRIWANLIIINFMLLIICIVTIIFFDKIFFIINKFNKNLNFSLLNLKYYTYIVFSALLIISLFIYLFKLKPPKFDYWVRDIAAARLNTKVIFFDRKKIYIEYNVSLKRKEIQDFITEISDKSNYYTYYIDKIDIDRYVVSVIINKKQEIPKLCVLDKSKDDIWNIIPLGEARNNELKTISVIGWYLNDLNVKEDMVKTLPSTSFLVAGGTGSGKSVVENTIIGHITRHSDKIQGLLVDVKKVEFGGLENYKGIKKVGLTVRECSEILKQVRQIMYDRFSFMEQHNVNNIYKLKTQVDYFEIDINGQKYQFDEIFYTEIDNEGKLLTIDKIYEEVQLGNSVSIKDTESNEMLVITKNNIHKTQDVFNPKAIIIVIDELSEIMNDNDYKTVSNITTDLGSIARLGRAAGCHLCLATQRPSSNIINADLRNNIQMSCLLGDFDSSASTLVFDKDISDLSKPEIKGRGFIKTGKEIIEFQAYYTEKEKDFELKPNKVYKIKNEDENNCYNIETDETQLDEENKIVDVENNFNDIEEFSFEDVSDLNNTNKKIKLNIVHSNKIKLNLKKKNSDINKNQLKIKLNKY